MARPKQEYSEAKARANAAYDRKTYKSINIKLRLEDDVDLIASYEAARQNGIKSRDWLRSLKED